MIESIRRWLSSDDSIEKEVISTDLAAAALLVEVMWADQSWDQSELDAVAIVLQETLAIDSETAHALIQDASAHRHKTHDLHSLTSRINETHSAEKKYELVHKLWLVAYADGNIHRYEDHMIRRISELLYVSHSQFIKAKVTAGDA